MNHPALVTTENKQEYPILIVDKNGQIGEELANTLKNESLVVFVSKKQPHSTENIIHIPFFKRFPTIPDNNYSYIFLIDENMEVAKESIQAFIKKAKNDSCPLILGINLEFYSDSFLESFIRSYNKAKVVVFGDIFKKEQISKIPKITSSKKTGLTSVVPSPGMLILPDDFIWEMNLLISVWGL